MLRLLYLLLRQRARPKRGERALDFPARRRRRAGRALAVGMAALMACVAAGVIVAYKHFEFVRTPLDWVRPRTATLALRVDELASAPLVAYLDVPGRQPQADPGAMVKITSVNASFEPRFQVVPIAGTVEVGNRDPVAHNTHVFDGQRTLFNVAVPLQGVRVQRVLGRPGIFEVRCDFHPWMHAWLFVPAGPYHAVVWAPGEASVRDIPPGSYALHVWTPAHGDTVRTLTFGSGEVKSLQLAGT